MKTYFRRVAASLLLAAALFACTFADMLEVGGILGSGEAAAGTTALFLGDTPVQISISGAGGAVLVALHENEGTAVRAARQVIAKTGGTLIELKHGGTREIAFSLGGKRYAIDPNRMFTPAGIKAHLRGGYSPEAHAAVAHFAEEVASLIRGRMIVSLHNNTAGSYSIRSYEPGGKLARDAKRVHIDPAQDPDDFFFVTSARWFEPLKKAGYNVAVQSARVTDDGSLSVYAARRGISYVNVEAENGHGAVQAKMLEAVLSR